MKQSCKKPCPECPFTKTSAKGWLGPWTPETIHRQVMDEGDLACHMTVTEDDVDNDKVRRCVGSVLYMNKGCKKARDPDLAKAQAELKGADMSNILNPIEFFKHHGSKYE